MIRRKGQRKSKEVDAGPKGFDDYALRLGDMMRGERATLGKSLLDVQRELRIRASYIAAIENSDPTAFETPGFIAGYVRSYARYLGMNPEDAFETFCKESGFETAHGMSSKASTIRKGGVTAQAPVNRDPFASPNMPFTPAHESILSRIEPQAIGSSLVLVALIGAIGYGGWSVLNEIQRVRLVPVEQTPDVLSDLDPVAERPVQSLGQTTQVASGVFAPPSDTLDRLYRPQALDVPVLVARDGPISTLDPSKNGAFSAGFNTDTFVASVIADAPVPKVVADDAPEVILMAVRPAWVRVRAADGTVIFEKILDAGEEYVLPATEEPLVLRAGMSGSVYFKLNGALFGPAGNGSSTVREVALDVAALQNAYDLADLNQDAELARIVSLASAE